MIIKNFIQTSLIFGGLHIERVPVKRFLVQAPKLEEVWRFPGLETIQKILPFYFGVCRRKYKPCFNVIKLFLRPACNVVKLFTAVIYKCFNKSERLSLESLYINICE
jgi:hypothetical protein